MYAAFGLKIVLISNRGKNSKKNHEEGGIKGFFGKNVSAYRFYNKERKLILIEY